MSELKQKTSGIGLKDKLGYAFGDTAGCLTFSVVGSFLQMFYTDVLYISPAKIMVLFIVARLWDAANDPMWGAFVDTRKTGKNGKFLPYIKWGSLPLAVAGALLYLKIPGLSETQYLIFAYVTYIFYGMMYTVVTIPYGSLASVVTTDEGERSSLSMFRSLGAGLGGLAGQVILPLLVYTTVAETGQKLLDGKKLFIFSALLALISVGVYMCCVNMTKERVTSAPAAPKTSPVKAIKILVRNRPFIGLCIASMFLLATQQYVQTLNNYLFKDYFAKPALYSFVTVASYLPMVLILPFLNKSIKRFGKKELCAAGMLLAAGANLLTFFIHTTNPYVFLVMSFIAGFGMTFFILEIWALATDVINYQEKLSGQRDEGTSYAFFSFTRKLGQTVSGVLGTGVLGLIGYDAKNITPEAVDRMYGVSTLVPALTCLIMAFMLGIVYNLGKKKLHEIYPEKEQQQ